MIDLHSHIVYGIDDGSKSLEMSLGMLRMAVQAGTTQIFATPHVNRRGVVPAWQEICEKIDVLQDRVQEERIPITIHRGAEVELNYDSLRFLREGIQDYCLGDTQYILVELTNQSQPDQTERMLFELMLRGYQPVLAHPERYDRIMAHPERILTWMQRGILTQCNAGSFVGNFGRDAKRRVESLLNNHMISFLGSDAHRTDWRNPDIAPARLQIEKLAGGRKLWQQCEQNAAQLLSGKVIYPEIPDHYHLPKRSFFARLFSRE